MKVTETDNRTQITSKGVTRSRQFRMSQKQVAKSAQILGESLYNDRPLAVTREYSTNGHDAHIMRSTPERPIHVTLPTSLSPIFKVRDFGPGIPENDIYNVYTAYFESTKESEEEMNGFLGLGSKAGFAYADTFSITSVVDAARLESAITYIESIMIPGMRAEGASEVDIADQTETLEALYSAYAHIEGTGKNWKTIYTAYKNNRLVPCMDKQHETETDEETGVEVAIPLDESRDRNAIEKFNTTAASFYRTFMPRPVFHGSRTIDAAIDSYQSRIPTYSGTTPEGVGWEVYSTNSHDGGGSIAVMGNVSYPIDRLLWEEEKEKMGRNLIMNGNMILRFPTGMVINHPSRESLDRSEQTVTSLKRAVKRILIEIRKVGRAKLDKAETMWAARVAFGENNRMASWLKDIIIPSPLFNGKKIETTIMGKEWQSILNDALGIVVPEKLAALAALEVKYASLQNWQREQKTREIEESFALIREGLRVRHYGDLNQYTSKKAPSYHEVDSVMPSKQLVFVVAIGGEYPVSKQAQYVRGGMIAARNQGYARMIMMIFASRASLERFKANVNIAGAPFIEMKDVEPYSPPVTKTINIAARAKQKSKEFVFKRDASTYRQTARSESWDSADVDLTDGEGYYVLIDQFEVAYSERNSQTGWLFAPNTGKTYNNGNDKLKDFLTAIESIGIAVPAIYGFRATKTNVSALGKGWKPFSAYVEQEVGALIAVSNQQRANHNAAHSVNEFYWSLADMVDELPVGQLQTLVAALTANHLEAEHTAFKMDKVTKLLHYQAYSSATVESDVNFEKMLSEIEAHYPLITAIGKNLGKSSIPLPVWAGEKAAPIFDIKPPKPLSKQNQKDAVLMQEYEAAFYTHELAIRAHEMKVKEFMSKVRTFEEKTAERKANRAEFLRYLAGFPGK